MPIYRMLQLLVVIGSATFAQYAGAVGTEAREIEQIEVQGGESPKKIYVKSLGGGWGAQGCADAVYAVIPSSVSDRKEILSVVLAAKTTKSKVRFYGSCDTQTQGEFVATYVIIY